jgi:hypothetical protein
VRKHNILNPFFHPFLHQVVLSQFMLYYFVPMLVIAFNYVRLACFLHKSPVMSVASARNTRRASFMVFLAAGTFSICWLPGYDDDDEEDEEDDDDFIVYIRGNYNTCSCLYLFS